jgi:hypothetical protein
MKQKIAIALLALVPVAASCTATQLASTDAERAQIVSLESTLVAAELTLSEATASGDVEAIAAAQAEVASVEAALKAIEERAARERVGGLVSIVSALPLVGPYVAPLSPLLLGLAPLLGKRGRKHAKALVRNLNPFDGTGGSWTDALGTLMKYLGVSHSSPESETAANTTA